MISDKVCTIQHDVAVPTTTFEGPSIPPEPPPVPSITDAQILAWINKVDCDNFTSPVKLKDLVSHHILLQADGGANRSVTNLKDILTVYWDIDDHHMGGIGKGIKCTGKGLFPLVCTDGSTILIEMFYSEEATCTVISPTDMVFNSPDFDS